MFSHVKSFVFKSSLIIIRVISAYHSLNAISNSTLEWDVSRGNIEEGEIPATESN